MRYMNWEIAVRQAKEALARLSEWDTATATNPDAHSLNFTPGSPGVSSG
jgi:hypothetical protein